MLFFPTLDCPFLLKALQLLCSHQMLRYRHQPAHMETAAIAMVTQVIQDTVHLSALSPFSLYNH